MFDARGHVITTASRSAAIAGRADRHALTAVTR